MNLIEHLILDHKYTDRKNKDSEDTSKFKVDKPFVFLLTDGDNKTFYMGFVGDHSKPV